MTLNNWPTAFSYRASGRNLDVCRNHKNYLCIFLTIPPRRECCQRAYVAVQVSEEQFPFGEHAADKRVLLCISRRNNSHLVHMSRRNATIKTTRMVYLPRRMSDSYGLKCFSCSIMMEIWFIYIGFKVWFK